MRARADWLAGLLAEADTSALLARSALRQRDGTRAVARFDDGIRTLAPADAKARWSYAPHNSPHKYTASLHEAQSSGEQRLLVEQSGKHQHQRM